jgi:hypothetical protein
MEYITLPSLWIEWDFLTQMHDEMWAFVLMHLRLREMFQLLNIRLN